MAARYPQDETLVGLVRFAAAIDRFGGQGGGTAATRANAAGLGAETVCRARDAKNLCTRARLVWHFRYRPWTAQCDALKRLHIAPYFSHPRRRANESQKISAPGGVVRRFFSVAAGRRRRR